ncbi:GNAT family N-acetyltransferase [Rhodococcus sp. IEGM 1408]|uniref:GNAT family N-acetyltransferase n=1 Tax=Rhodococcus sp. IEGM 1408 TaxID=3082220 RepID=UPI002954D4E7|nr:GNAT family N-acetyltransferase [Rhodococcus sp. IEGM 1408]MDV8000129.1 GNAT family N-acetyltransferase [Rhodococcus sp. IEGM 1408]
MSEHGSAVRVIASPLAELGPMDVHALYKLRVDVFVAEQDCPYAEIDEVDADPGTTHLLAWGAGASAGDPEHLVATLRLFGSGVHGGVMHLGRVCTAPEWRGQGIAAQLIRLALSRCGDRPVEIGAQAHLERWYEQFGFVRCGEDYLDGRIPHLPMRRDLLG